MKFNQNQILVIVTEGVVAAVILGVVFIKNTSPTATNAQPPTQASVDSMTDHHTSVPADSAVFDGLMNKPVPDFSLQSYDGKTVNIKDFRGKNVVLFFNEGLMCYPACWNQIIAFGKDTSFAGKNTVILNITVDSKDDWKKAIDKMPELAGNTVLLDPDRTVAKLFGVLTLTSSMHKGQFPGHTFILVDKDGVVRYTLDDPAMAIRNTELLTEIAKL